jgi:hypothetical protein
VIFSQGNVRIIDEGITITTGTFSLSIGLYQLDQFSSGRALKASNTEVLASLEV